MKMDRLLDQVLFHFPGNAVFRHEIGDDAFDAGRSCIHVGLFSSRIASARVSPSTKSVFLPTRRRSRADRSTVASRTPSPLICTSVPRVMGRSVCVNSIAPRGVSKRPGEPVVMHVKTVDT